MRSKAVTAWRPRTGRSEGRTAARWADDIVGIAGRAWIGPAQERRDWYEKREGYAK